LTLQTNNGEDSAAVDIAASETIEPSTNASDILQIFKPEDDNTQLNAQARLAELSPPLQLLILITTPLEGLKFGH
jgi:hypothetical protein